MLRNAAPTRPQRRAWLGPLVAILSLAGTLCLLELLVRLADVLGAAPRYEDLTPLFDALPDSDLGYVARAETRHRATKGIRDGAICYDVVYTLDEFGRRTTPSDGSRTGAPLLLFGGSATFGEGLADEDSLQSHLERLLPDRPIFNYALPGYGPNHALALLQSGELPGELPPPPADALYLMIPAHIDRVVGTTRTPWIYDSPSFELDERGEIVRRESFRTGRPLRTAVQEWLVALRGASALIGRTPLHLPPRIGDGELDLVFALLAELSRTQENQVGGELTIVLHPLWGGLHGARVLEALRQKLRARPLLVLDYADHAESPGDRIGECDAHPSGQLNERLASLIVRDSTLRGSAITPPTTRPSDASPSASTQGRDGSLPARSAPVARTRAATR